MLTDSSAAPNRRHVGGQPALRRADGRDGRGGGKRRARRSSSIHALLAERLDRLNAEERAVVERASVIGKEFVRREIFELCPPELRLVSAGTDGARAQGLDPARRVRRQ